MNDRNTQRGFTLIELVVAVAVLAVAASFAVPAFTQLVESNRLATESNRLFSAMSFARSEAVRVGDEVSLSAKTGGFDEGWCVHLGAACTGTDILRQFDAVSQLDYSSTGTATSLTFNARGERASAEFEITIVPDGCDSTDVDERRREVSVSPSGRAAIQKGNCA